jgi:uncharacterized paraquat-inducible protein A
MTAPDRKPVSLRCPACAAPVTVPFAQTVARCARCRHEWRWKQSPKRVAFNSALTVGKGA